MKKMGQFFILRVSILMFLSGCCRIIDWSKDTLYQGIPLDNNISCARSYIRTLKIYDEFTTRAIFDVMWLSDVVRETYSHVHAVHFGQDKEQKESFLRRQLGENDLTISFYVLSLYENPLDSDDSEWTVFLTSNGTNYFPKKIKAVELPHEYKLFWGAQQMRFKTAYELHFNARDSDGYVVIRPTTQHLTLQFRSADKKGSVSWRIDGNGCLLCDTGTARSYVSMRKRCLYG